ncbi:MAG: RNA polymerase sigma-70 factor [Tannerella sp.]|jgi:RNA polymerase sigma-70 factor (ECF subfamily)|nr:RNA polymerase sigma-70 factor [Tannerella sp.]
MNFFKDNFEKIYAEYYDRMFLFAKEYVVSEEDAENIVQDIFMLIWEKKDVLEIKVNLSAYLFTLIKNKCIDHLRHTTIVNTFKQEYKAKLSALEVLDEMTSNEEDLEKLVNDAISKLPERCRIIFTRSRFECKKYHEIAAELNISPNTVENQMAIALKKLRKELKDYLPLLLFMI